MAFEGRGSQPMDHSSSANQKPGTKLSTVNPASAHVSRAGQRRDRVGRTAKVTAMVLSASSAPPVLPTPSIRGIVASVVGLRPESVTDGVTGTGRQEPAHQGNARRSFPRSFHLPSLGPTGAHRLDDPPDLTSKDGTTRDGVDGRGSTSNP
jgi:hypothetical protein